MIIYKLNGLDFSKLVYGTPSLYKKTGKGDKLVVSNIRISVINDYLIFSPENEESFLYQQSQMYVYKMMLLFESFLTDL